MKGAVCTAAGVVGAGFTVLFGGWTGSLTTLVILMAVDYISGLMVAGVFHASQKTPTGTLESRAGWKGLCRKGMTLLMVLIACRLDRLLGSSYVQEAVTIGFIANEGISIAENVGLMGLPLPNVIVKAFDVLDRRAQEK